MLEEHIEMSPEEGKGTQLSVKVSQVPLNLVPGTNDSLEFLDVINASLDNAFYTPFSQYINYKWDNDRYYQYPITLSNVYFGICLDLYTIFYGPEPESSHTIVMMLAIYALLLFSFEVIQLYVESP